MIRSSPLSVFWKGIALMNEEYIKAEKRRFMWVLGIGLALLIAVISIVLAFTGQVTKGLTIALAALICAIVLRSFGTRQYTTAIADMRVRYGLKLKEAERIEASEARAQANGLRLLPDSFRPNTPLHMYPFKGIWQGYDVILSELTVTYQIKANARHFMSGTLMTVKTGCAYPGLMAVYGKVFTGVPVDQWKGMTAVDTGDRGFQLLAEQPDAVNDYVLDNLSSFDRAKELTAVIWTEAERICVFLPLQFYSGNWSLPKPMPQAEASADPLPALAELPKVLKKLA